MQQSSVNALVTGAGSGIGFELVKQMLTHPQIGKVIAIGRRPQPLQALLPYDQHNRLVILPFDICSDDRSQLFKALSGVDSIGLLVNNAGELLSRPFAEISQSDLESVYRTNVFAPFRLIREALPWLQRHHAKAHVVNIGSIGGLLGSIKFSGLSAYSSSKGALAVLTECLAEEHRSIDVAFNCLALGAVQTDMLKAAFPSSIVQTTPEAIAPFILNFGLESANLFNGKVLAVSSSTP